VSTKLGVLYKTIRRFKTLEEAIQYIEENLEYLSKQRWVIMYKRKLVRVCPMFEMIAKEVKERGVFVSKDDVYLNRFLKNGVYTCICG